MLVGVRTLTGGAITLTGAITGTNDFTVDAAGALTLNSDITIGGGRSLFERGRWRHHEWQHCARTDGRHGEPHAGCGISRD